MQAVRARLALLLASVFLVGLGGTARLFADEHVRGVITEKQSGILLIQTDDASNLVVVVGDFTKVRRVDGMRQASVSSANLIPGLRVVVEGQYDTPERFIAEEVDFKRSDLKVAVAFQATERRSRANQERLELHAQAIQEHGKALTGQAEKLASQADTLGRHALGIENNELKIVGTTGELAKRIGNLDNYTVIDTMTVHFRNGSDIIGPEYRARLQEFARRAGNHQAYTFQVQGFASAPGSESRNEKLSKGRADAVIAVLQQHGVPLTSIVVPAAMGETQPIAENTSSKGQAENRRAVITLLQNKGIAAK
jgi:outer membrane protein OmpA-like peptidoglycan-associated protein